MSEHIEDVIKHKEEVGKVINQVVTELVKRAVEHDHSKFSKEEMDIFEEVTPRLRTLTYGSEEYKQQLKEMKSALDRHYINNSHHPEYYKNGIKDMTLIDIVEMICDWMGAVKRHDDGDILRSIKLNQERFDYSDELKGIFINTVRLLYKYNIVYGCSDGREGEFLADTIEEIHRKIDNDKRLLDIEKEDLKYGFFREFRDRDYETKNITWDNSFSVYWTRN